MPKGTCSINACEREHYARGWCQPHYNRWRNHGDPLYGESGQPTPKPLCSIDPSHGPACGRGWCSMCLQRWRRTGDPLKVTVIRADDERRFWSHVDKRRPDECWLWTAGLSRHGYAPFSVGGKAVGAHRWAYERFVGPIPEGLVIDHMCHVAGECTDAGRDCLHRRCVNPMHLKAKPHRDNVLRGNGTAAVNARKTHCDKGQHEFTPENTYIIPSTGGRVCRTCEAARWDRGRRRRRDGDAPAA
jgi:hypothetical protein